MVCLYPALAMPASASSSSTDACGHPDSPGGSIRSAAARGQLGVPRRGAKPGWGCCTGPRPALSGLGRAQALKTPKHPASRAMAGHQAVPRGSGATEPRPGENGFPSGSSGSGDAACKEQTAPRLSRKHDLAAAGSRGGRAGGSTGAGVPVCAGGRWEHPQPRWQGQEQGGTSISPLSRLRRAGFYFWKQFNGLLIALIGFVSG